MNGPFQKQFKQTNFTIFTLMTLHSKKHTRELIEKYEHAGVFVPFGVGIYQKKGENTLHLSILTAEAQNKIVGKGLEVFKKIEAETLAAIKKHFPNAKHSLSEDSLKSNHDLVTIYELDLDGEDWEEMKDELEMNLDAGFKPYGFVVPEFLDVSEVITEDGKLPSKYDFYQTYSICKLPVIYTVAKSRPEASAFAPCTTMMYKKHDEDKIVIGFPGVYNWLSSAKVEDVAAKKELLKAQRDFEAILQEVTE
jgi:uncharacterized protein (DUF302 family)